MNILCKIKGHQFKPDITRYSKWDDHGNCVIISWCERCGERHEQPTGTPHTFLPQRQKTEYRCEDLKSHHTCWKEVSNQCTTCGYVQEENERVFHFEKNVRRRHGCTHIQVCPGCQQSFDFQDLPHQYDQLVKIEANKDGCHQVMQCSQCGMQSSVWYEDVVLPHEWSEFTVVSTCERFRTCARCGYKEEILTHQWQSTGEKWDIRDYEVAGGAEESWQEREVCPVCHQSRVVARTYNPPF